MPREKETYRDNLELLSKRYDDQPVLHVEDIKKTTGQDIKTMKKDKALAKCGFNKRGGRWCITLAGLARYLS